MPPDTVETRVTRLEVEQEHMSDFQSQVNTKLDKLDGRIAKLEKFFWMGVGIVAVLQVVVPLILKV